MARRSINIDGFKHGAQPIPAASRVGPLVMTGGVYGLDRSAGEIPADVQRQVRLMFENLEAILTAAGGTLGDVARMTVYVKDDAAREPVNAAWLEAFPDPQSRPARHTLRNDHLPGAVLVQCDATAWIEDRA